MTEGSVTKTKRMGTRFFKNPPQPHMCIQDFLRGSVHPCYVNVLSWDKIAMACPFERLPLYGGIKINPPRTERPEVAVFFVMANPEILKKNGKNASDPKEQLTLIDLLLDFIEAMNKGVMFMRQYKILNDRDITGELKEIWMMVQNERAKVQNDNGAEEAKRPVPQYPTYQDPTQDQQKQHQQKKAQQQQQYRSIQNQHQHLMQMHPNQDDKQLSQPPQYQPNYSMPSRRPMEASVNYDPAYVRQPQNTMISPNDRIYQSRPITTHCNVNRVRDRYMYRDPIVSNIPTTPPPQSSVPYPTPQYQYQQLPRQMGAYSNPNVHPTVGLACSTISNSGIPPIISPGLAPDPQSHYDHYYLSMRFPEKRVCAKVHRMQQQQQIQIQVARDPSVPPYEQLDLHNAQANSNFNLMRIYRPQTYTPPKSSPHKRHVTSPTHPNANNANKESFGKSTSPVKVLQRDSSASEHSSATEIIADKISVEIHDVAEKSSIQITDLDEDEPRAISNDLDARKEDEEARKPTDDQNKKGKTKIMVLRKNKSANDIKSLNQNGKTMINGIKTESEHDDKDDRTEDESDDEKSNKISQSEQNGYECTDKQIESDDKVSNGMNIIKNNLKISASTSEDITVKQSSKVNGQSNNFSKDKEIFEMYAIYRKSEVTAQDELTNEMAQMSIKDCTDTSEIGAVPS